MIEVPAEAMAALVRGEWDMTLASGLYRYVNHQHRLLTVGFGEPSGLRRNADIMSFQQPSLQVMRDRYELTFGKKKIAARPCELKLVGEVDRLLSEMKYVLDHPDQYDEATFQTVKHHLEDMELFLKYAEGELKSIRALPPIAAQGPRGY